MIPCQHNIVIRDGASPTNAYKISQCSKCLTIVSVLPRTPDAKPQDPIQDKMDVMFRLIDELDKKYPEKDAVAKAAHVNTLFINIGGRR